MNLKRTQRLLKRVKKQIASRSYFPLFGTVYRVNNEYSLEIHNLDSIPVMTDKTVQGVIDQLDDYINNNSNLLDRLRYLDSVGCKVKVFVNVSGSVTLPRNWIEVE